MLTGRRELTLSLPADAEVDVEQALAAAARARVAIGAGDPATAWEAAAATVAIAGRRFLPAHDAPWVHERRTELEDLRLRALELAGAGGGRARRRRCRRCRAGGGGAGARGAAARGRAPTADAGAGRARRARRGAGRLRAAAGAAARRARHRARRGGARPARAAAHRRAGRRAAASSAPPGRRSPRRSAGRAASSSAARPSSSTLRAAWAEARAGSRRLVLLRGGPGIGKTRLAGELAREAHADGTVLYGGCLEDALVAYQPFVEALRHYARSVPTAALAGRLGAGAAELAALIPELAPPEPGGHAAQDPETRALPAVRGGRRAAGRGGPASPRAAGARRPALGRSARRCSCCATSRAPSTMRALLIVGTYRDTDVGTGDPLPAVLADLRREGAAERIRLDGLDRDGDRDADRGARRRRGAIRARARRPRRDRGQPVLRRGDGPAPDRDGRRARLGAAGGDPDARPASPRGSRRCSGGGWRGCPEACRGLLAQAAVLGREFAFDVLLSMSGDDEEAAIDALEEALGAQLVVETAAGGYAFTHALVRETLYEGLSAPRRQRMHARAARAIEAAAAPDPEARIAALAIHLRLAGAAGDPAKGDRVLAARRRARPPPLRLGRGGGPLGRRAGADGAAPAPTPPGARGCASRWPRSPLSRATSAGRSRKLERALELYEELGDEERAAQVHSRLGQAHSLIDSIDAEHLDITRAFAHFDAARAVLGRGAAAARPRPPRGGRGHGAHLRAADRARDRGGAARDGDRRAARRRGPVGGQPRRPTAGTGSSAARCGEGFAAQERAFERADRGQRPLLAWMALNIRGQFTWGLRDPDGAQAHVRAPARARLHGRHGYAQERADGIGRCHISRGDLAAARRLLPDARTAWISHSLAPLVDLWEGRWDEAEALARSGPGDEPAHGQPLGRVGRAAPGRPRAAPARRARAGGRGARAGARDRARRRRPLLRDLGAARPRPRARRRLAAPRRRAPTSSAAARSSPAARTGADGTPPPASPRRVVLSARGPAGRGRRRVRLGAGDGAALRAAPDEADALHQRAPPWPAPATAAGAAELDAAAAELYARHGAGPAWLELRRRPPELAARQGFRRVLRSGGRGHSPRPLPHSERTFPHDPRRRAQARAPRHLGRR